MEAWVEELNSSKSSQAHDVKDRVPTHFLFQNSIVFQTQISRLLGKFFGPYLTSEYKELDVYYVNKILAGSLLVVVGLGLMLGWTKNGVTLNAEDAVT